MSSFAVVAVVLATLFVASVCVETSTTSGGSRADAPSPPKRASAAGGRRPQQQQVRPQRRRTPQHPGGGVGPPPPPATAQPAAARIDGDIVLGGLFPVHGKDAGGGCGDVQKDRGIQRLEAMLFAVDHINANRSLLAGVRLGAHVLDTCSRETYALDQALEYVRASLNIFHPSMFHCDDGSNPDIISQPDPVIGVVGGSYSSVSIQVIHTFQGHSIKISACPSAVFLPLSFFRSST